MTLSDIAHKVKDYAQKLEKGELHADDIMEFTSLAQQLYERSVVLRHKAFENSVKELENDLKKSNEPQVKIDSVAESSNENIVCEPQPESNGVQDEPPSQGPSFRISDTVSSPNQISLIDSIEEIKRMERSLNESFKDENSHSLAQKLHQKPISNLKTAISINQKFKFISNLFKGDKNAFDQAIATLDSCTSFLEADEYLDDTLSEKFDWEEQNPSANELKELVHRRFIH